MESYIILNQTLRTKVLVNKALTIASLSLLLLFICRLNFVLDLRHYIAEVRDLVVELETSLTQHDKLSSNPEEIKVNVTNLEVPQCSDYQIVHFLQSYSIVGPQSIVTRQSTHRGSTTERVDIHVFRYRSSSVYQ